MIMPTPDAGNAVREIPAEPAEPSPETRAVTTADLGAQSAAGARPGDAAAASPVVATPRGECRIIRRAPLLDAQGHLAYRGYATSMLPEYHRSAIRAAKIRIKEWDYYLVNDNDYAVALTISDLGYAGMLSASVLDFRAGTYTTTSQLTVLPLGKFHLPETSIQGESAWQTKRVAMHFSAVAASEGSPARRELTCTFRKFRGDEALRVQITLDKIPRDSMVIATPWAEDPRAFYFNQKIVAMRAQGSFTVGTLRDDGTFADGALHHEFSPEDSFGLLDWGRGVWTHDNTWYWGVAQGWQDGQGGSAPAPDAHRFGLNIGYGFGDTSAASENMVFVDGVAHKLGRLDFGVPERAEGTVGQAPAKTVADKFDLMSPWHIRDDEGRLDLVFTPKIDRADYMNVGALITDQHQCFGVFNGQVELDDGSAFVVHNLRGAAEVVHNKY